MLYELSSYRMKIKLLNHFIYFIIVHKFIFFFLSSDYYLLSNKKVNFFQDNLSKREES